MFGFTTVLKFYKEVLPEEPDNQIRNPVAYSMEILDSVSLPID